MDNFIEALKLMGVGLASVFFVLWLVIVFGNGLIKFMNNLIDRGIVPEEDKTAKKQAPKPAALVDANVQQAINKAVEQLTAGKGRVEKIVKL